MEVCRKPYLHGHAAVSHHLVLYGPVLTYLRNSVFLGGCLFCTIFQLPMRYQVIHGTSPLGAGLRTMPFIGAAPVSSVISATLTKKGVPPLYLIMVASILEIIGFALMATIPPSAVITTRQYGYQILAGLGCGSNLSLLVLLVPFTVRSKDTCTFTSLSHLEVKLTLNQTAVAMGAVTQFRLIGSAVTLSIINTVRDSYLRSSLKNLLTPYQIRSILEYAPAARAIDLAIRESVLVKVAEGYNLQTKVLAGIAGMQLLAALLMWQKKQIKV